METCEKEEQLARSKIQDKKISMQKDEFSQLVRAVDILKDEKEKSECVINNLLEEANSKLKIAIGNKDFTGVAVAQLMFETLEDERKKGPDCSKILKKKELTLRKRQGSVIESYFSKKPKLISSQK